MPLPLEAIHSLPMFIAAGLALNLAPGADVALIASRSTALGFRAGAAAALGVGVGGLLHTLAAALGLSAVLATSTMAFALLRWVGAAYLVWLGWGLWRAAVRSTEPTSPRSTAPSATGPASLRRCFSQGVLTNALNPKVALFFLAFVPQFIATDAPNKALAFIVLGVIFNVFGTLVNLGYAGVFSALRQRLNASVGWSRRLGGAAGLLFMALGVKLALGVE